jgi:hypothetical protein
MFARTVALTLVFTMIAAAAWVADGPESEAGTSPGRIVGTVTDGQSGLPVPGAQVDAYDGNHGMWARSFTDQNGAYELAFDSPLSLRIFFSHRGSLGNTHVDEWYDHKPDFASADVLNVAPGTTLTANAALARGGTISGRVTAEDTDEPVNSVCVSTRDAAGKVWLATSGYLQGGPAGGLYEIAGLGAGSYILHFEDCLKVNYACLPPNLHFLAEWYDDALSLEAAQPVVVALGEKTGDVDVALVRDPATPDPNPTPTPGLTWTIDADRLAAGVGDAIEVHAGASGNGGIPYYRLNVTPENAPVVIEQAPDHFASTLGISYTWRLRAVRPGQATVSAYVNYETSGCYCPDRETCSRPFFFTSATSPEVSIDVGAAAGDANADGPVDAIDAALILQLNAGLLKSLPGAPDANNDGRVDAIDAALVLQLVAGLIDELPG